MAEIATNLPAQIEREHYAALTAARDAIDHAVRCGELLTEAKKQVDHGEWLPWIETNLTFGARQAQKYMHLAENQMRLAPGRIQGIEDALAHLRGAGSKAKHEAAKTKRRSTSRSDRKRRELLGPQRAEAYVQAHPELSERPGLSLSVVGSSAVRAGALAQRDSDRRDRGHAGGGARACSAERAA
jgi:hypothetical protein